MLLTYYLSLTHPSDSYLPILESILTTLHSTDDNEPDQQPDLPEEQSAPSTPLPSLPTPSTSPVLQYDQDKAPFPPPQTTKAPWWTYIRDGCESSLCLRSYLHIAVTCRSICIKETQALPNKVSYPVYVGVSRYSNKYLDNDMQRNDMELLSYVYALSKNYI